jgi:hypothetical protein
MIKLPGNYASAHLPPLALAGWAPGNGLLITRFRHDATQDVGVPTIQYQYRDKVRAEGHAWQTGIHVQAPSPHPTLEKFYLAQGETSIYLSTESDETYLLLPWLHGHVHEDELHEDTSSRPTKCLETPHVYDPPSLRTMVPRS